MLRKGYPKKIREKVNITIIIKNNKMKRTVNIIAQEIARYEMNESFTQSNYKFLSDPTYEQTKKYWNDLDEINHKKRFLIEELLAVAEINKAEYSLENRVINLNK